MELRTLVSAFVTLRAQDLKSLDEIVTMMHTIDAVTHTDAPITTPVA